MNIRKTLNDIAKNNNLDTNLIHLSFALERIVARMTNNNELSSALTYKGGYVLFRSLESRRVTRDLDALAQGIPVDRLEELVAYALQVDMSDGIRFTNLGTERLTSHRQYEGLRISCAFEIAPFKGVTHRGLPKAQFDISFGDHISDQNEMMKLESYIDDLGPISWKVYLPEFIFSEKLHALFTIDENTRSKDVHDLIHLYPNCQIEALIKAIGITFKRRDTPAAKVLVSRFDKIKNHRLKDNWPRLSTADNFADSWRRLRDILEEIDAFLTSRN